MAGFGKAVWSKFGEFRHRRQWRFNINLWNRPQADVVDVKYAARKRSLTAEDFIASVNTGAWVNGV